MEKSASRTFAHIAVLGALLVLGAQASAQTYTPPLSVSAAGPTLYTTELGRTLQTPFRLRVVDGAGQPVAGIPVTFQVDTGACFGGMCPPFGTSGFFLVAAPPFRDEIVKINTDSNGIATSPTFRTTDTLASVWGGIGWSYEVSGNPHIEYQIVEGVGPGQAAGATPSVLPVNAQPALWGLCALLALVAVGRLRRRKA